MKTSSGKLYWPGMGIDTSAETDLSGNLTKEFIYFAGRKVARRTAFTGADHRDPSLRSGFRLRAPAALTPANRLNFADQLGSSRVVLTSTGSYVEDLDFYPFGGLRSFYSSGSKYKFTGYERDTESNLDYAIFRHFGSTLGRFYQPDPLAGSVANPQSLNRYAYVLNDPVNGVDPLGLGDCLDIVRDRNGDLQVVHIPCPPRGPDDPVEGDVVQSHGTMFCNYGIGLIANIQVCIGGGILLRTPRDLGDRVRKELEKRAQTLDRAKTCAKAYYGFDTLPGAAADATRVALIPAAPIIPKALVGFPRALGSGPVTNLLSLVSLGSGTAASGANVLRIAGRIGAPIAIAAAIIDAAAITTCTLIDQ